MRIPFLKRRPQVALLRLSGVIAARGGIGPGGSLSLESTAPLLERAFALKRLQAVVLVLNSPGGSPVQSSLIAARIRQLAEEKKVPVIACCEDAAASGGYWLACAADEIIADPSSIVGSIGVISASFGLEELAAKLGVERRLATAGDQKSFLDPFRPVEPWQQARLEELLTALHGEFKSWVRSRRGRHFKVDEGEVFNGRFWTGREALALGLVDGLGDADGEIRRRFGEKAQVVRLGPKRPPLPIRLLRGAMAVVEERLAWGRIGL
ncbi:S49 family peptidase [Pseudoroseomonas deserti]|uniref:S49 family peptidase n=1 Tax=Teichococcus deserti TaxID=1817963 RepID=A0A1V2GXD4_9PROT|nr:S49 family peptidase [Pseudoroseomonas deserti]ONG49037.1 S49 family peptidase [Pseudoroseomonas deserti]